MCCKETHNIIRSLLQPTDCTEQENLTPTRRQPVRQSKSRRFPRRRSRGLKQRRRRWEAVSFSKSWAEARTILHAGESFLQRARAAGNSSSRQANKVSPGTKHTEKRKQKHRCAKRRAGGTAMSHELGREDSVPPSPVAEGSTGGGVAMPTPTWRRSRRA